MLFMSMEVIDLVEDGGMVVGVMVMVFEGLKEILADFVVVVDGCGLVLWECVGFVIWDFGVLMDVLWFCLFL